jgi:hypothetical protein
MADEQLDDLATLNDDSSNEESTGEETQEETSEETTEEESGEESDGEQSEEEKSAASGKVPAEEETEEQRAAAERLRFKDITAKYPNLFKDFPHLRHVFFQREEYAGLFPTVEDAREAAQKAESYSYLEADLLQGNPQNLLASVAQVNPQAFRQIVEQFLPTVYGMSKDTFYEVTQPILTNALRAAFNEGSSNGDKNLALAAQYINRYLFGKTDIDETRPVTRERQPDPERQKFEEERQQFVESRKNDFTLDVQKSTRDELVKLVSAGLDPKNELNDFTRQSIIDKTLAQIGAALQGDARHMAMMMSLWRRAEATGLSAEHKARIIQAFIGRAKELMPAIRAKVRSEATGNTKRNITPIKRTTGTGVPNRTSSTPSAKKIDWGKTSDLDVLNDNVKLRG